MGAEIMRLSKSRINLYLDCPKKYYYEHIAGLRKFVQEPPFGTPLRTGIDVHELFEWYYLQEDSAKLEEPYEESMRAVLDQNPLSILYPEYVDNFVEFNLRLISENGVPDYLPEEVEMEVFDPKLNLIGIIDAVYYHNGVRTIIDYKTSKQPKGIREYLLELTLYKIIYEQATGNKVDYCGIYFPFTNQFRMAEVIGPLDEVPDKTVAITLEDELEAITTVDIIRERIKDNQFERNPGFLCRYCDYEVKCKGEDMLNV
jgi:CRISPR/Cas system-associated exonuclease Cas4 (RecB family)